MSPKFNERVATALAGLFGQEGTADCHIVFTKRESRPPATSSSSEPAGSAGGGGRKKKRNAEEREDIPRVVGEPLPAHTLVLRLASEPFKAQVERRSAAGVSAGAAGPSSGSGSSSSSKRRAVAGAPEQPQGDGVGGGGRPQPLPLPPQRPPPLRLLVPLGSEEELPAARAAIKFAYTGQIEAGSVREALQVRQQADYLQVDGCVEACVAAVREMLRAAAPAAAAGAGAEPAAAGPPPAVLQLYGCTPLWPVYPEKEPAFAALLTEAKPQLVAHFGDALAVLNSKQLYEQMRALPAEGLEVLLESDDFGTDSESSVVLMLAEWMAANYSRTDAAARRRLCGLLRLAQCSRAYLDWVLPALALDHHCHPPDSQAGWFEVTPDQASCVAAYAAAASDDDRSMHREVLEQAWSRHNGGGGGGGGGGDSGSGSSSTPEAWLTGRRRRQCVPPEGLDFSWACSKERLCDLDPGGFHSLFVDYDATPEYMVAAMGLHWVTFILYNQGETAADMVLSLALPGAYTWQQGAQQESPASVRRGADWGLARPVASLDAAVYLHKWQGGQRQEVQVMATSSAQQLKIGGNCFSWSCINLAGAPVSPVPKGQQQQGQQERQGQEEGQAVATVRQQLERRAQAEAQWAEYLHGGGGGLTGCMRILRPA